MHTDSATHPISWEIYESPIGPLTLRHSRRGLRGLHFPGRGELLDEDRHDPQACAPVVGQLEEYFAGSRVRFELELDLVGTPFQLAVWEQLLKIPHGSTTSYSAVALNLGRRDRVRAVGAAVGRTPVPIIVPCHRVVAVDGALTGYGGGLERKRALLDLERRVAGATPGAVHGNTQLALL
jgi:methylated-DNA-[protein]-cysteine S-methyltransferase